MFARLPLATELVAKTIDDDRLSAAARRSIAARADQPLPERTARTMTPRRLLTVLAAVLLLALVAQSSGVRAQDAPPVAAQITLDADGDDLIDEHELQIGTNPNKFDTDGDGLGDGAEFRADGWNTNPLAADTDGDGLHDGNELFVHRTDPKLADSDGDGLSDGAEVNRYRTDPLAKDSDRDGFDDGVEINAGSNPADPKSVPSDDAPEPSPTPSPKPSPSPSPAPSAVEGAVATQLPNTGAGTTDGAGGFGPTTLLALAAALAVAALVARRRLA